MLEDVPYVTSTVQDNRAKNRRDEKLERLEARLDKARALIWEAGRTDNSTFLKMQIMFHMVTFTGMQSSFIGTEFYTC